MKNKQCPGSKIRSKGKGKGLGRGKGKGPMGIPNGKYNTLKEVDFGIK